MLIAETFDVNVPAQRLFDLLLDPNVLGAWIPGCEQVKKISENEYESIIKTKVGIIATKFRVKSIITDIIPPTMIRTKGEGRELRGLGHFKQKTEIVLRELSEAKTEVSYRSDVSIVGRLATFGERVMRAKAKELGKEFAEAIKKNWNKKQ